MKKLIVLFLITYSAAILAQETRLRGQLPENLAEKSLRLSHVNGFETNVPVADDGSFDVHVAVSKPGIYELKEIGDVYLRPGFDLTITSESPASYRFQGTGSTENNLMVTTKKLAATYFPMHNKQLSFAAFTMDLPVFIDRLERYQQEADAMVATSTDGYFTRNWRGELRYFVKTLLHRYQMSYGIDSVKQQEFFRLMETTDRSDSVAVKKLRAADEASRIFQFTSEEVRTIQSWQSRDTIDLRDGELFENSPAYRNAVNLWLTGKVYQDYSPRLTKGESSQLIRMEVAHQFTQEPRIREYILYKTGLSFIKMDQDSEKSAGVYKDLMASLTNERYRSVLQETYHNLEALQPGSPAPDFAYEAMDGRTVRLSDLRGRYVFIDVWATWCAPCKAQIPHVAKLEEDYGGKNLAFVSISVDRLSDKGKWRSFVEENELTGIQVFADNAFDSDFVKKLNINSIPRFILIDPEGKIVSANTDWPSRPALRTQLDELL